jgi:hypothetical protein
MTSTEIEYFSKLCCHFKFQELTLSGASVASTSLVYVVTMLVLLWEIKNRKDGEGLFWHDILTIFQLF